jgi:dihydrofolate reductase
MACDPRGLIGKDNVLPWHCPEEQAHFRHTIQGQVMVMGRKTFEATPKTILDDSHCIVFSKVPHENVSDCTFVSSIESFQNISVPSHQQIFMIGGAEIAHLFLRHNLIQEFILSKMHQTYEGNIFLNLALLDYWPASILQEAQDYTIHRLLNPIS